MKIFKAMLVVGMLAVGMCGCMRQPPSMVEISGAYFGDFPTDYVSIIKRESETFLFDAYLAHYNFDGKPSKVWMYSGKKAYSYGWGGIVYINAKNRLGAYVGQQPYEYFIQGPYVKVWQVGLSSQLNYVHLYK